MLIQLTQKEIEASLRAYIAAKGIDLAGKTVTTVFTASRKGNGISCELDIEDADIPGLETGEPAAPALKLVAAETPVAPVLPAAETPQAPMFDAQAEAPDQPEAEAETPTTPAKPVTSLFG